MDDQLFSNIVSASLRMADTAKVEMLREASKNIVEEVIKSGQGVFIVYGLRGVGKTTILSEVSRRTDSSIYLSGDVILKYGSGLLDILHHCEKSGYKTYMVDEIHALPDWEKDVKIFYDETHAKILVSGSSAAALRTKGSELSRRATLFELKPLSFREYVQFKANVKIPKAALADILDPSKRPGLSKTIFSYANEFDPYLRKYALPVSFFENKTDAYMNIVERIVRYDLEVLREIDVHYIDASFRIIKLVAISSPGEISYSKISKDIGRSIKFTMEAVRMLALAGIFYIIPPEGVGHDAIRSEDKILMPLSFRSALCEAYGVAPSIGGLREDFFIQHVDNALYIKTGAERRTPDYRVGDKIFEIGGPTKGWAQLKEHKNAYLVKESLTVEKNEIPLYLFGLLY